MSLIAPVSTLVRSTFVGCGQIIAGPLLMAVAGPAWIKDIVNKQTVVLGSYWTARSLFLLGAETTFEGLC